MSVDTEAVLGRVPTGLFIGGQWIEREARFDVHNPANGETIATVADGTGADAVAALDACVAAQAEWARSTPRRRSDILLKAWQLLTERVDDFAALITLEMGKPFTEAKGEVAYAADYLRWFAEEATRVHGEYRVSPLGDARIMTTRQPVGPCLLIAPWNFPLAMITRKVGPALAAGCTMVIKPAHETPLTCLMMAKVFEDAGVPAGVLNVVTTSRARELSTPLMADPRLRKVSFTGSTGVGRTLLEAASANILRTSMELGGNAPFLVFADADLDQAVAGAMVAKFRNGGESCVAANRFLVQAEVAEQFAERLAEKMAALVTGDGFVEGSTLGPLITDKQRNQVHELVTDAVGRGARLVMGGTPVDGPGYFYPPTLLVDVPSDARISVEEIFGPVAAVQTFQDEQEAVRLANRTEFGLTAFVFTRDLDRGVRVAEAIESGMVGINRGVVSNAAAPFGGVKSSGLGREGGFEGINEYLAQKYISLDAARL